MTDRNPMLQNLNNPVAGLGIVPGKAMLDDDTVEVRKSNARNPLRAITCYPGGDNNLNHNIQVGDLVFGRRGNRDVDSFDGEPNELVTSSVAGLCWSDCDSKRELEGEYYFVGVAAGEEHLEHPLDSNQIDSRNGFGTIRVGTVSVINNGDKTFYPGDLVKWRFPDCGLDRGHHKFKDPVTGKEMAMTGGAYPNDPQLNMIARYGEEPTKFRPEIVPFDPADLGTDLAGSFSTILLERATTFQQYMEHPERLNSIQNEALAYRFGIFGIAGAVLECMARKGYVTVNRDPIPVGAQNAAADIHRAFTSFGVFNPINEEGNVEEALADVFLNTIGAEEGIRDQADRRFREIYGSSVYNVATTNPAEQDSQAQFARIRLSGLEMMARALASTVDNSRRNIIGRCTSASALGDTTDLLLGHTY